MQDRSKRIIDTQLSSRSPTWLGSRARIGCNAASDLTRESDLDKDMQIAASSIATVYVLMRLLDTRVLQNS